MADFCKKCSIEMFGKDCRDLAGLGNGQPLEPSHGWAATCEGCWHKGSCVVDADGLCLIRERMEKAGTYVEGVVGDN